MNCWHCNTELRWVGDHDADELTDNNYTILSCLECPECKSWVEVYYPNPEEEKGELNEGSISKCSTFPSSREH